MADPLSLMLILHWAFNHTSVTEKKNYVLNSSFSAAHNNSEMY